MNVDGIPLGELSWWSVNHSKRDNKKDINKSRDVKKIVLKPNRPFYCYFLITIEK